MPVPNIPANYLCPIMVQIMFDPVIAEDGCTYEREAIEQWFNNGHNTSPMGHGIIGSVLIPNRDKKFDIMQFLDNHANFIHEAIKSSNSGDDNLEFINALIKRNKANLDRQDDAGQTPLHTAVIYRKVNIIQLLLQAGADYKIRNHQHKTPKKEAKDHEFWDIVNTIELEIKAISQTKLAKIYPQIDESSQKQGILNQIEIMQYEARTRDSIVELEETAGNQIKTELDVAKLTQQMQLLSVSRRPQKYLRLFTLEILELLALGTAVIGASAITYQYKKLSEHSETIEQLQEQISINSRLTEQVNNQNYILKQLNFSLRQEQQTQKQAVSFLYDKMKETYKVAFKTESGIEHSQRLPIPHGFVEEDCSFFTMKFLEYYGADTHRRQLKQTDNLGRYIKNIENY